MSLPGVIINDRRAHDRHPFRTSAALVMSDGRVLQARTLDVGKGGAGVVVDVSLPVDAGLTIRMNLPARPTGSALFEARATVVSCSLAGSEGGFRIGLQFGTLEASALAALKGVLP
ncbi:MAG: PilZ domain-containing protein [Rubrivivax sp.]|nr:PilZ domain-containing protein [Rubrivivax sp.]